MNASVLYQADNLTAAKSRGVAVAPAPNPLVARCRSYIGNLEKGYNAQVQLVTEAR